MLCPLLLYTTTGHKLETRPNFAITECSSKEVFIKKKTNKQQNPRILEAEEKKPV